MNIKNRLVKLILAISLVSVALFASSCSSPPKKVSTVLVTTNFSHPVIHVGDYLQIRVWHTDWKFSKPSGVVEFSTSNAEGVPLSKCAPWAGHCGYSMFQYKAISSGKVTIKGNTIRPEPSTFTPNSTCNSAETCGWTTVSSTTYVTVKS